MKYKNGDKVLLTDIYKGDATRYGSIVDNYSSVTERKAFIKQKIYWVKLLTGNNLVFVKEDEIIKKLTQEEFDLVKVILD